MLVVMKKDATEANIQAVVDAAEKRGYVARPIPGGDRVSIGILYNKGSVDSGYFLEFDDVKEVIPVTKPYKLVSREIKKENTLVKVGDITFGDESIHIIAGPCAIETEEQALTIAHAVKKAGAVLFRGGAFKPRTSPYSFQGLEVEGLKILAKVREETSLPIVTEVMDCETFKIVEEYTDVIQIGTRNMQNFSLLKRAGKSKKPVVLKRGMSATLQEWLMAAEYILGNGNPNVILCERGIRTFAKHSRNTLDLSVVLSAKKESHLPVIVDPSHASGVRDHIIPLSLAATAVGADGLIIEVHHKPKEALCDGAQSLYPNQFEECVKKVNKIHSFIKA